MSRIDCNDQQALERYDAFLQQSPWATFYQDRGWACVKNNWQSAYFIYEREDAVVGAVSALSIKAANGHPFIYCSRGPVIDPDDIAIWRDMLAELRAYAQEIKAFYVRFDPELAADPHLVQFFTGLGLVVRSENLPLKTFTQPRCNAVLDLEGKSAEKILMGFDARKRYDIRVGLKHNISYRQGRDENTLTIFSQMIDSMSERKGIAMRDKAYFQRLLTAFPTSCITLASYEGTDICGALMLPYGRKITFLYAASLDIYRSIQAPNALLWHLIEQALDQKYTAFDLGGVFGLDGSCPLYAYKKGFVKQEGITCYIGELDLVLSKELYADFIS